MQFEEIKSIIKKECKQHGVEFYHGRGKTVMFRDRVKSNGYFTDGDDGEGYNPRLAIATGANTLDVLVHEYCHMQQYLEQTQEWLDLTDNDFIWRWIDGEDGFTEEQLDNSFKASYMIELDCEMRSVRQHREWETGLNEEEYIQKANAYTMFYLFMRENRVWYKSGREPYSLKEVWSQMPKSFTFDRVACYNQVHQLFELCI